MVTHSSILAWRIPWTEEPGGWQSRLQGDVHDGSDLAHKLQFPYPSRGRPALSATRMDGEGTVSPD